MKWFWIALGKWFDKRNGVLVAQVVVSYEGRVRIPFAPTVSSINISRSLTLFRVDVDA